jgi:hypothetical protein
MASLFPFPDDPSQPLVQIPYIATFDYEYDNTSQGYFGNFAMYCGFGNFGVIGFATLEDTSRENTPEELASLLQSWLFLYVDNMGLRQVY